MGLFAPTPWPVSALNRVQVMYTLSALGLPGLSSATMSSLSLKISGPASLATTPIVLVVYSWNAPGTGVW